MSELVRKIQIRLVGKDKSIVSKTLEVDGHSTDRIKFASPVSEAYVNCCNEQQQFEKNRKTVSLPGELSCNGCGTTYGMKRENSNNIKVYGTR